MPIFYKLGPRGFLAIEIGELLIEFESRHFENCRDESNQEMGIKYPKSGHAFIIEML
jgi:hypothetical protein